ncbi:MAG: hypothetical protein Q9214_001126 [Letrouitia sp. 1 TL-2023]
MTSRIPTSTSVNESAVIAAPLAKVWHFIKLQDFRQFWSKLEKSDYVKGASSETDVVKWTFKDGTILNVKQEEHSSIDHYITYSVIESNPALTYSSVMSTVRCYPVTSGTAENSTFVTWSGNFSSDADAGKLPTFLCTSIFSLVVEAKGRGEDNDTEHTKSNLTSVMRMTVLIHVAGVIEDAKFKRREALADLAAIATK